MERPPNTQITTQDGHSWCKSNLCLPFPFPAAGLGHVFLVPRGTEGRGNYLTGGMGGFLTLLVPLIASVSQLKSWTCKTAGTLPEPLPGERSCFPSP